jgi:hypothetical protein
MVFARKFLGFRLDDAHGITRRSPSFINERIVFRAPIVDAAIRADDFCDHHILPSLIAIVTDAPAKVNSTMISQPAKPNGRGMERAGDGSGSNSWGG